MHRLFIVCILLISTLFSSAGLFIPISDIPAFLRWTRHINPMKYSNDLVSDKDNQDSLLQSDCLLLFVC